MRLYEGTITEFNSHVLYNEIADIISKKYSQYYHKLPAESEYRAWQQSLNFLNNAFSSSGLEENKLVIEYGPPYPPRRIDALLFGMGQDKRENVVLIELKQWSNE